MTIVALRPSVSGTSSATSAGSAFGGASATAAQLAALRPGTASAAESLRPVTQAAAVATVSDDAALRQESAALLAALARVGGTGDGSLELAQLRDRTEAYLTALRPVAAAELAARGRQMIVMLSQGTAVPAVTASELAEAEAEAIAAAQARAAAESAATGDDAASDASARAPDTARSASPPPGAEPGALFAARRGDSAAGPGADQAPTPGLRLVSSREGSAPIITPPGLALAGGGARGSAALAGPPATAAESVVRAQASAATGAPPTAGRGALIRTVAGVASGLWLAVAAYSATAAGWVGT